MLIRRVLERTQLLRLSLQSLASSSLSLLPHTQQHASSDDQEKKQKLFALLASRPLCSLPQMAPAAVTATRGRTSLELAETRFKDAGECVLLGAIAFALPRFSLFFWSRER
jgi:hypothetical protein